MNIWYIRETEDGSGIMKTILLKTRYFFGMIKLDNFSDKVICTLPITNKTRLNDKKIIKIFKKLKKKLYKYDVMDIVLSEFLSQLEMLKNKIYSEGIKILEGRTLFTYLIYDVIEYIAEKKRDCIVAELEVGILTNDNTDSTIDNIELISKETKSLSIITNNIEKFSKLETYLYQELGIMVKVSNNKKKALSKIDILINIDFPRELINKYNIPDNCIIINVNGDISIDSKRFNGINVCGYKILIPEEYRINGFRDEDIYESIILRKKR